MDTEELYQELILESSQSVKNRGDLTQVPEARHELVYNPLCGDAIDLWIKVESGVLAEIKFSGQGCAISQSAASLLADEVRGKKVEAVKAIIEDYQEMLSGQANEECLVRLGSVSALEGVSKFPMRLRCALIAVEALKRLIDQQ